MLDNPLWSEGAQAARLAELMADTADPAKELPLRRDVRTSARSIQMERHNGETGVLARPFPVPHLSHPATGTARI